MTMEQNIDRPVGVAVEMSRGAAALVYASRLARAIGLHSLAGTLLRKAGEMTPGIRLQIWKGRAGG